MVSFQRYSSTVIVKGSTLTRQMETLTPGSLCFHILAGVLTV